MNPDGVLARLLAEQASQELLKLRDEMGFDDPAALRAAGDRRSHEVLTAALAAACPHDAVLSEEAADNPARLAAERVWIIDPLDGTREFGEPGRTDWAVHVAVWRQGHGLVAGAVALPAVDDVTVLATDTPPAPPAPRPDRPIRIAVSRTRPPAFLDELTADVRGELVPMGSAGAKAAAVITGEVDAYVHAGGQYEWDSAAPVAVALATGLHASRLDGRALRYNRERPSLPDLLVCRRDLAGRLLDTLRRLTALGDTR